MKFASRAAIAFCLIAILALGTGASAAVYSGSGPITIPSSGPATPYPATITVSGALGSVMDVEASLADWSHTWPDDVDILLVGPAGQTVMLSSDAGGSLDVAAVDLTFDDAAGGSLPDSAQITSGTYKPSNYGTVDPMPAPAPAGPHGSTMAVFNGTDANGTWKLFVADDLGGDLGSIASWSLDIRSCLLPEIVAITDTTPAAPVVDALLCT